jgi:hypothetical protein
MEIFHRERAQMALPTQTIYLATGSDKQDNAPAVLTKTVVRDRDLKGQAAAKSAFGKGKSAVVLRRG